MKFLFVLFGLLIWLGSYFLSVAKTNNSHKDRVETLGYLFMIIGGISSFVCCILMYKS